MSKPKGKYVSGVRFFRRIYPDGEFGELEKSYIVDSPNGAKVCTAPSKYMAKKIAKALNRMRDDD